MVPRIKYSIKLFQIDLVSQKYYFFTNDTIKKKIKNLKTYFSVGVAYEEYSITFSCNTWM